MTVDLKEQEIINELILYKVTKLFALEQKHIKLITLKRKLLTKKLKLIKMKRRTTEMKIRILEILK